MDLLRPHETEIHEQLRALALPHLERYEGALEVLPLDPQTYPAQDLRNIVIEGSPIDGTLVEALGTDVSPAFPHIVERLQQREEAHNDISRLGENLHSDQNIILVTNHGELTDIALTLGAFYATLQTEGYAFRSNIIISKMISHIGYRMPNGTAPAADLLRVICDDIFLSFPSTDSIKQSPIDRHFIKRYNKQLLGRLTEQFKAGRNLFAMAASGSVDKPLSADGSTIKLGGVSPNTAKLMMAPGSLVVPIAVWLKGEDPVFEICDIPRALRSPDEAHEVMESITETLNNHVAEKSFVYHAPQLPRHLGNTGIKGSL